MKPHNLIRQLARVVIIGILVPRIAIAQTPPVTPEFQLELKRDFAPQVVKTPTGEEGVWFNTIDAQYLLYMRSTMVPGLLKLDARNAQIVDSLNKQISMTGQISDLQGGQVALVKDSLKETQKELQKCRDEQSSIWRDPLFLAGIGFLAGILVTGGIVWAVRK
jgi:hypothetical protein